MGPRALSVTPGVLLTTLQCNGLVTHQGWHEHYAGAQNETPQDVPPWYANHSELKATKTVLWTQEKLLPPPCPAN